jgi:EF hand
MHLLSREHIRYSPQEKLMRYTLLTCGLLLAMSAFAADTGPSDGPNKFRALDTDGDHLISLAEAQAGAPELASRFSKIDANQDGLLSIDEVIAGRPGRDVLIHRSMPEDFAAADANADGMLTRTEAEKMPIVSDFFGDMDSNVDGHVTQDEIREHARRHGPIRVMKGRGPGTAKE